MWDAVCLLSFVKNCSPLSTSRSYKNRVIVANFISQTLRCWNMYNDICGLWKEMSDCFHSSLRKKQELPSTISIENSSWRMTALLPVMLLVLYTGIMKAAMAMHLVSLLFLMIKFGSSLSTIPNMTFQWNSLSSYIQDAVNVLSGFPHGPSPVSLGLLAQHLLDAICEHVDPATQDCSQALTILVNFITLCKSQCLAIPGLG